MAHFNVESGWKRGQGARRMPGRPGGRGRGKRYDFRPYAMHGRASVTEFGEPWVELVFETPRGMDLRTAFYLLDQAAHRLAFNYTIKSGRG